jgi:hypothetical protein
MLLLPFLCLRCVSAAAAVPPTSLGLAIQHILRDAVRALVFRGAASDIATLDAVHLLVASSSSGDNDDGASLCALARTLAPRGADIRTKVSNSGSNGSSPPPLFVYGERGGRYTVQQLTAAELCARFAAVSGGSRCAAPTYVRHAVPRVTLNASAVVAAAAGDAKHRPSAKANYWFSNSAVHVQAHYDLHANLYVQLVGRKRFALAPPTAIPQLQMYPGTHSSARQSRRDTSAAARRRDGFWRELELGPGDVLLLPPNTVHRVDVGRSSDRDHDSDSGDGGGACTGELSASLSVWWDEGGALSALRTAVATAMDVEHVGLSHFITHTRWRDATRLALGLASVVRAVMRRAAPSHAERAALWRESVGRHVPVSEGAPAASALRSAVAEFGFSGAEEDDADAVLRLARRAVELLVDALLPARTARLRDAELLDLVDFAYRAAASGSSSAPAFIARVFS